VWCTHLYTKYPYKYPKCPIVVCTHLYTKYPYKYPKCPIVVCTHLHTKYPYKYPKCPIEFQKGYEPTRSLARWFVGAFDRSIDW